MISPRSSSSEPLVEVAVPLPVFQSFTYRLTDDMAGSVREGDVVEVTVGKKLTRGCVIGFPDRVQQTFTIKNVVGRYPWRSLAPWQLSLARSVAMDSFSPFGETLSLFIPSVNAPWRQDAQTRVFPTETTCQEMNESLLPVSGTNLLLFREAAGVSRTRIATLINRNTLRVEPESFDPLPLPTFPREIPRWWKIPFREEREVFLGDRINESIRKSQKMVVIFPDRHSLSWGQHFLTEKFPTVKLVVFHGKQTPRQRFVLTKRVEEGDYQVLAGTHPVLFFPVGESYNHIVFDPEERGHFSDRSPRYSSLRVLLEKIRLTGGRLDAVGVAPDITMAHYLSEGRFRVEKTFIQAKAKRVNTILQGELKKPLTLALRKEMAQVISRQGTAVLWVQKKGYSPALGCRDCGFFYMCPHCEVAYRYYKNKSVLNCSLCGRECLSDDRCPSCGGAWLTPWGQGVERMVHEVRRSFPGTKVVQAEGEGGFSEKEIPFGTGVIVVGTEAVLRETLLRRSLLFAVISLEEWVVLPDYRVKSIFYQKIRKALTWLGRDVKGDAVFFIQVSPHYHHEADNVLSSPGEFFMKELTHRKHLQYPPVFSILRVVATGRNSDARQRVLRKARKSLENDGFRVFGPLPSAGTRREGVFSDELVIQYAHQSLEKLYSLVASAFPARRVTGIRIDFEPD